MFTFSLVYKCSYHMNNFTETELKYCRYVIDKLLMHPLSKEYLNPVDADSFPNYLTIVHEPMDLGTIKRKLDNHQYESPADFKYDINLVWSNSKLYLSKKKTHLLYHVATMMEAKCNKLLKKIPRTPKDEWLLMLDKANRKLQKFLKLPTPGARLVPRKPGLAISEN